MIHAHLQRRENKSAEGEAEYKGMAEGDQAHVVAKAAIAAGDRRACIINKVGAVGKNGESLMLLVYLCLYLYLYLYLYLHLHPNLYPNLHLYIHIPGAPPSEMLIVFYHGDMRFVINVKGSLLVAQDSGHDHGNLDFVPYALKDGGLIVRPCITSQIGPFIGRLFCSAVPLSYHRVWICYVVSTDQMAMVDRWTHAQDPSGAGFLHEKMYEVKVVDSIEEAEKLKVRTCRPCEHSDHSGGCVCACVRACQKERTIEFHACVLTYASIFCVFKEASTTEYCVVLCNVDRLSKAMCLDVGLAEMKRFKFKQHGHEGEEEEE